jgi:hypothetical protein
MIDEDSLSAIDHSTHSAVDGRNLDAAFDHLDRAAVPIDDDRKGRSLHHGSKCRRIDGEMRNTGVTDLEKQGPECLHDPRESRRLGR